LTTPLQQRLPAMPGSDADARDPDSIDYLAEGFSALADPTRLRVVHLLMTRGEMCVCEFMPLLGVPQSNVSFHLKALKYAGFITSRRDGRWMLYRLNRKAFEFFRAEFGSVFDPGKWSQEVEPASRSEALRRRPACQREQNQLLHRT